MHEAIQIRVKLGVLSHVGVGLAGRRRVQGRLGQWAVEPDRAWPGMARRVGIRWVLGTLALWLFVPAVVVAAVLAVVSGAWRGGAPTAAAPTSPASAASATAWLRPPAVGITTAPFSAQVSAPLPAASAAASHADGTSLAGNAPIPMPVGLPHAPPPRAPTTPSLPQPLVMPAPLPTTRPPMGEVPVLPAGFGTASVAVPEAGDMPRPASRPRSVRAPSRNARSLPSADVRAGDASGRSVASGSSVDDRAPSPVRADVLVAIKNARTVVVPDERGLPVAVHVGDRLPSGARLLKVHPTAGEAETDRGLLRLE